MKKILITGTAGFIGFHLVKRLIKESDWDIVGIDNINNYYDVNLKYARLRETGIDKNKIEYNKFTSSNKSENYRLIKLDLVDKKNIVRLFKNEKFNYVVHLAAQAGVRYSIENPDVYIDSNIYGFFNILEGCRYYPVKHLIYASSSSVYGANKEIPFSENNNVDLPISLYAATKKSNELMAHVYSHLFGIPSTGLRFFTVYGPWGRPDMALFKFTKAILNDEHIEIYNNGNMLRDFTYIDDIIEGIYRVIKYIPKGKEKNDNLDPSSSIAPYKIYNIGNSYPISLNDFIAILEKELGKKAKKFYLPIQPGDVIETNADISNLRNELNYSPTTNFIDGIRFFIAWYKDFYGID